MAEGSDESDELPRCSTLFLEEDGEQMLFYMTPCAMKTRLRPLIHHGGGHLSSKVLKNSIKLAVPGSGSISSDYISTDYIFDSIKHNRLQDMNQYKLKSLDSRTKVTSSKSRSESKSSTVKVSPSSHKKHGRHKYTYEEDLALIKFVNKHTDCCPVKGNALYKKAEKEKITGHSWQSMRDHYIKYLDKYKTENRFKYLVGKRSRKSDPDQSTKTRPQASKIKEKAEQNKSEETDDEEVTNKTSKNTGQATMAESLASKVKEKADPYQFRSEEYDETSTDQPRLTRAQASKLKEKHDSKTKCAVTEETDDSSADTDQEKRRTKTSKVKEKSTPDQSRVTRAQSSNLKGKNNSKTKCAVMEEADDSSADTDQENITRTKTSKVKEKSDHGENGNDTTDFSVEAVADSLPDVANTDNKDDESSAAEDVDYDKLFDENLLKLAYESKKKKGSASKTVESASNDSKVSSSQETVKRPTTRSQKTPLKDQEKLSDFDGEVVFRGNLKSPSAKVHSDEEDSEDKRPLAKRNKRDLESLSDDENSSGKERKRQEAFFKFNQALQSYLQKLPAGLTVPQVIHALLVNSGNFNDAEKYIQNGSEVWTSKEDKILLSKNKEEISALAKKRGLQAVVDRMDFMEGIN